MANEVYLFDWGDTLMVDFPGVPGRMCDWERVEAVEGAHGTLRVLSAQAKMYIATSAAESRPEEIENAFKRVELAEYISGYFCRYNTGFSKPDVRFYQSILSQLDSRPQKTVMVGDSIENDIRPCILLGMNAIWFNRRNDSARPIGDIPQINRLAELVTPDSV